MKRVVIFAILLVAACGGQEPAPCDPTQVYTQPPHLCAVDADCRAGEQCGDLVDVLLANTCVWKCLTP